MKTVRLWAKFYDLEGDPIDVEELDMRVLANGEEVASFNLDDVVRESEGVYYYDYTLEEEAFYMLEVTGYIGQMPQSYSSLIADMRPCYSSPKQVISYTGVRPTDFGLEDDDYQTADKKLESLIKSWLVQVKDLIDMDRNRDYHQEVKKGKRTMVPSGINNIALRMAANMVAQANLRRLTPIVRHDDFSVDMVEDKIFTNAIKRDLARFPYKPNFKLIVPGKDEDDG